MRRGGEGGFEEALRVLTGAVTEIRGRRLHAGRPGVAREVAYGARDIAGHVGDGGPGELCTVAGGALVVVGRRRAGLLLAEREGGDARRVAVAVGAVVVVGGLAAGAVVLGGGLAAVGLRRRAQHGAGGRRGHAGELSLGGSVTVLCDLGGWGIDAAPGCGEQLQAMSSTAGNA